MNKKAYKRLPGKARGFFTCISLWQGGDHLLLVRNKTFMEEYRRFAYKDIQCIYFCQNRRKQVMDYVLLPLSLIFLFLSILFYLTPGLGLFIFCGSLFFAFALVLGLNAWQGPTCNCFIKTAVQNKEIQSLRRTKKARKALKQIIPLIAKVQGHISNEQLPKFMGNG